MRGVRPSHPAAPRNGLPPRLGSPFSCHGFLSVMPTTVPHAAGHCFRPPARLQRREGADLVSGGLYLPAPPGREPGTPGLCTAHSKTSQKLEGARARTMAGWVLAAEGQSHNSARHRLRPASRSEVTPCPRGAVRGCRPRSRIPGTSWRLWGHDPSLSRQWREGRQGP